MTRHHARSGLPRLHRGRGRGSHLPAMPAPPERHPLRETCAASQRSERTKMRDPRPGWRTRFAPSPTGALHVGFGAHRPLQLARRPAPREAPSSSVWRTRTREGTTPAASCKSSSSLRWLGLDWDEGPEVGGPHDPYVQSLRTELYRLEADRLVEIGAAYWCTCTPARLEQMRAEQRAAGRPTRYDRRCLGRQEEVAAERAAGAPAVPPPAHPRRHGTEWVDLIRGPDRLRQRRDRRPGPDQGRRVPHLSPRQRGRRPRHGDHPRDPGRGVDPLDPQAPLSLCGARLGAATLRPRPGGARRGRPEAQQAPGRPQHPRVPRGSATSPARWSTPWRCSGWSSGTEEEVFDLAELAERFSLDRVNPAPAVFDAPASRRPRAGCTSGGWRRRSWPRQLEPWLPGDHRGAARGAGAAPPGEDDPARRRRRARRPAPRRACPGPEDAAFPPKKVDAATAAELLDARPRRGRGRRPRGHRRDASAARRGARRARGAKPRDGFRVLYMAILGSPQGVPVLRCHAAHRPRGGGGAAARGPRTPRERRADTLPEGTRGDGEGGCDTGW